MNTKAIISAGVLVAAIQSQAITVYAIDDNLDQRLLGFDSMTPGVLTQARSITGLQANERLVGIDVRSSNGLLYGIGSQSRIYTLNLSTGAATFVASISVPLDGTEFGVDFNPVADRIRVVSNLEQNLRINPDTGVTIVDGSINPGNPAVTASAYTNPDNDPGTGTTLYGIDAESDNLVLQNPPNGGTISPVGALGIDVTTLNGFDIYLDGVTGGNVGIAAFQRPTTPLRSDLYGIDLSTGAATLIGQIGQGQDNFNIRGMAVVPEPVSIVVVMLGIGMLAARHRR